MKRPLNLSIAIIVLFFWILPVNAGATIYHFANNGNDTAGNGSSGNPYKTLSKLNSINYNSGDEIYLRAGDTFDDKTITLAACTRTINGLTLRGADFGGKRIAVDGKPLIDGDKIQPIYIDKANISNLTIKDIDVSGAKWKLTKSKNVIIKGINNLLVDGLDYDGFGGSDPVTDPSQEGSSGINFSNTCSGTIEVKNSNIQNCGPAAIPSGPKDIACASWHHFDDPSTIILFHDNVVCNANSDPIQGHDNQSTPSKIYNNTLCNGGEQVIDVKHSDNFEIYNNVIYYESDFGYGGTSKKNFHSHIGIGGANDAGGDADDNSVHDNEFYGSGPNYTDIAVKLGGLGTAGNNRTKIYNNYFHDLPEGIRLGEDTADAEVYKNTFVNVGVPIRDIARETVSINQIYSNTINLSSDSLTTLTTPKNLKIISK